MPCVRSWPIKESAARWESAPERNYAALAGYIPERTGDLQVDTSIVYDSTDANTEYYNLGTRAVRWKCVQLCTANLFVHSLGCLAVILHDLFHAITLNYFLIEDEELIERVKLSLRLIAHLIIAPFLVIALECTALLGICMPHTARKYLPRLEVVLYGMNGAASHFGVGTYRPLYHCLTIPFYPCWVVKNHEDIRLNRGRRDIFEPR